MDPETELKAIKFEHLTGERSLKVTLMHRSKGIYIRQDRFFPKWNDPFWCVNAILLETWNMPTCPSVKKNVSFFKNCHDKSVVFVEVETARIQNKVATLLLKQSFKTRQITWAGSHSWDILVPMVPQKPLSKVFIILNMIFNIGLSPVQQHWVMSFETIYITARNWSGVICIDSSMSRKHSRVL